MLTVYWMHAAYRVCKPESNCMGLHRAAHDSFFFSTHVLSNIFYIPVSIAIAICFVPPQMAFFKQCDLVRKRIRLTAAVQPKVRLS